jgi:hypothetical protein
VGAVAGGFDLWVGVISFLSNKAILGASLRRFGFLQSKANLAMFPLVLV